MMGSAVAHLRDMGERMRYSPKSYISLGWPVLQPGSSPVSGFSADSPSAYAATSVIIDSSAGSWLADAACVEHSNTSQTRQSWSRTAATEAAVGQPDSCNRSETWPGPKGASTAESVSQPLHRRHRVISADANAASHGPCSLSRHFLLEATRATVAAASNLASLPRIQRPGHMAHVRLNISASLPRPPMSHPRIVAGWRQRHVGASSATRANDRDNA